MGKTASIPEYWYSASELAGLPGLPGTERGVRKAADREQWEYRKKAKGKGCEYSFTSLPEATQAALTKRHLVSVAPVHPAQQDPTYQRGYGEVRHVTEAERAEAWAYWARLKDTRKAVANERMFALREVLALRDAGVPKMQARAQVGRARGVSVATLTRWEDMVGDAPRSEWMALLVERKKGHSGRKPYAECDDVVWTWFRDHWLSRAQPSWADAYRRVREMADAQGWACPSLNTLKRRVRKEIPYQERVVRREGDAAIRRLLPVQVRDALDCASGEVVNGDGVTFDPMWIRFEDGERVKGGKAWFWQDIRSRRQLAYRLDKSENTDVFRLATYDLTAVCTPVEAVIDNTRAAANKTMTAGAAGRHRFKNDPKDGLGLLLMLGIEPRWTNPDKLTGNPGSKPIERAFGIGGIPKLVLNNPRIIAAGRGRTKETAIDVALVREVLDEEVARFNAQAGRRTQACRGELSFDQAWEEGLKGYVPRVLTAEQRRVLLMSREVVKLSSERGQVYLKAGRGPFGRNAYWTEALAARMGERVVVLYDPEDLHRDVAVYTLEGDFICEAECVEAGGWKREATKRNHNKLLQRKSKAMKKAAETGEEMDAVERAELYVAALDVGRTDAEVAAAGAGAATGATDAGGARVVQGHFQKAPGRARRGNARGAGRAGAGAVVAFPEGGGRGQEAARAAADAERRRAMEAYTERVLEEKLAGVL